MQSYLDVINSYIGLLESRFISKNTIGYGWYRDLKRRDRVGNVATAQIILIYTSANKDIPCKKEVFKGLLDNRLSNGSWPFISNISEVGVIDSTSWVLLALLSEQSPYRHDRKIWENSFNWLLDVQNDDGGWGIIDGADSRVVSTAFAIRALIADNNSDYKQAIKKAIVYLLDSQCADYSWRNTSGKSCVGVTSHAIIALSSVSPAEYSLTINRAADWLIKSWKEENKTFWDHLYLSEEIDISVGGRITRFDYYYPVTPLAIRALRISTISKDGYSHILKNYLSELKNHYVFHGTKTSKDHDTSYGVHDIVMSLTDNNLTATKSNNLTNFDLNLLKAEVNDSELPQLFQVHRAESNDSKTINLVFFHGLGGHPIDTWLNNDTGFFLPIGLLSEGLSNINIFTLGYDNSPSTWLGGAMSLYHRSINIIQLLENELNNEGRIVLVGHSFGGLLIKSIISAINSSESQISPIKSFLKKISGVCFIATPHSGSGLANLLNFLKVLAPSEATKDLEKNNPELSRLNDEYKTLAHDLGIVHLSFAENEKTKGVIIVPRESANLGYPGSRVVPIDANHITICKPKSQKSILPKTINKFVISLNESN